jgi:hypothetical protein
LEVPCKPQGGIWRNSAALVNDFRNARHRDMKIEREPVHAELKRLHELRAQNFAGMNGRKALLSFSHEYPLVIVDDLNVAGVPLAPDEAETPPIVDPDAVLSLSVAVQRFQTISRRRHQVSQFRRAVQLPEFPTRDMLDSLKTSTWKPMVKSPGFGRAERLNHNMEYITYSV